MADFDISIKADSRNIGVLDSPKAGARPAAGTTRARKATRASAWWFSLKWFLTGLVVLVGIAGVYESVTEAWYPAYSLVRTAHLFGYLEDYPVIYQPSKGIWRTLAWTGTGMMVVMMFYTVRKRFAFMSVFGSMRRWLSLHMFLGIMGPLLITFHTTFKFHGIVATSFWCMITTMVFGILGRYIYVQIPRSITGTELGVQEIEAMVANIESRLEGYRTNANLSRFLNTVDCPSEQANSMSLPAALLLMSWTDLKNRFRIMRVSRILRSRFNLSYRVRRDIVAQLRRKAAIIRKRSFLATSHRLLHYWHVFHIPLAIVMFLIMFIHIAVYFIFTAA